MGERPRSLNPSAERIFFPLSSHHKKLNISSPSLLATPIFTILAAPAHVGPTGTLLAIEPTRSFKDLAALLAEDGVSTPLSTR